MRMPRVTYRGGLLEPIKVLLVDDEVDFVTALAKRLQRRELEVDVVHSGEDALTYLEARSTDVMVLDVRMPGDGGVQTLRRVKREHPGVEVVMLSGFDDEGTTARARGAGAFDYLMKPTGIEDLIQRIQAAHAGHGAPGPG